MKKTLAIVAVLLSTVLLIGSARASVTQNGSISGYVFKADGVTVITDTLINVHAEGITPGSSSLGTSVSQTDGSYTITGLAPGTYKVQANNGRELGYVAEYYNNKLDWDEADAVEVVADQTTSGIDFALEPGGAISGHVFKADGSTVITDVLISVHAHSVSMGGSSLGAHVSQSDGSYTIGGLAPGNYKVQANNNREPGYVTKYFDDKPSHDEADNVEVLAHQTTSNIDFALEAAGTISGYVYEEDGVTPVTNACVNVSSTAPDWNQIADFCCTDADGSFLIHSVPPGDAYVRTHADCGGSHPNLIDEWYAEGGSTPDGNQATSVTVVAGQTTSGVEFTLDRMGSISGAIYNVDGSSLITDVMYAIASADRPGSYSSWCTGNGQFSIPLDYGSYKVFAQGDSRNCGGDPNYAREYWREKATWAEADIITLTSESPSVTGITFTLEPGASISGHVYESDGVTPISEADLWARGPDGDYNYHTRSQSDGSYTIGGLMTSTYIVKASADGYVLEWYHEKDNEWEADTVVVASPGTVSGIDFTLEQAGTITGHVYEEDGVTPVGNACVNVSSTAPDWSQVLGWCCTDTNGEFRIDSVPTGSHYVRTHANCQGSHTDLQDEWFAEGGSTRDGSLATPVVVVANQTTPNIDFTLDRMGTISGTVYDATGTSTIGRALVGYTSPNYEGGYGSRCADDDGHFVIPLASGAYKVFAHGDNIRCGSNPNYAREFWQEQLYWEDADVVTVTTDAPSAVLTFTLEMGGSIAGTVYNRDGTAPVGGAPVAARSLDRTLGHFMCAKDNGSYAVSGLPLGDYKVYASGHCGADPNYITEYWQEKPSWEDADVVTISAANREITGTDFTLELGGAISGKILKADGETPAKGACVNVSSTAPEWNQIKGYCCTGDDGTFTIHGVPTGYAYVRTHAGCQGEHPDLQDEWYAAGGSTTDASLAETIVVRAGQVVTGVDFALDIAATATILPGEGGTLSTTADVTTTVSLPPDAVAQPITITFKITTSKHISSGFSFLGQSFSIEATTAGGTLVTTFLKPLTITIQYDDDDVLGVEEESLSLFYWDSGAEQWETLPTTVYTETNTLVAVVDHLTDFAVMGNSKYRVYLPAVLRSQ